MPSLLSYRFEQLIHESSSTQKSRCRLLAIRLYVDDLESEKTFYANLLDCIPQEESEQSASFPLANGIRLILTRAKRGDSSSTKSFHPASGQVELELETRDLITIWQNLKSSVALGKQWIFSEAQQMLRLLSPAGLLLNFRQKKVG
jgi:hypothetical protein